MSLQDFRKQLVIALIEVLDKDVIVLVMALIILLNVSVKYFF